MQRNKKERILLVITFCLTFAALLTSGFAAFQWFTSNHSKDSGIITPVQIVQAEPEAFSKELPAALVSNLSEYGVTKKDIKLIKPKMSADGIKQNYTVNIPAKSSLTFLNYRMNAIAKKIGGKVMSVTESSDNQSLTLILGTKSTPTDMIVFRKNPGVGIKQIKAAIIIEDVGLHPVENLRRICNKYQQITLSILPFKRYTENAVEFASKNDFPYILDMPFESKSKGESTPAGSILITDSEAEIREKLTRALKNVKGAQGINNHLGSKALEDIQVMELVMNYLKVNNYFFVDTKASPETAGFKVSQRMGVKSAVITGYIDSDGNRNSMESKMEIYANAAIEKGAVILVGHDRPLTISVLEKTLPMLEQKGIRLVPVADIVK